MRPADLAVLALALAVAGCGAPDEAGRTIEGDRVAMMAEERLESENPAMSPGALACQDLELALGATTRCTRTARLSQGRWVRVNGTVTVTDVEDGGRLRVELDDRAVAYGVDGEFLAEKVADRFDLAGEVDCPDLDGVLGSSISCEVRDGSAAVTVVAVDPAGYDVRYTFGPLMRDRPGH